MDVKKKEYQMIAYFKSEHYRKLYLGIFLPPVLSLGYLRTPTFFSLDKNNHIHHVSAQVNAEDGDCSQGKGYVCNDEDQERRDFRNVTGQGVGNRLLEVIKDQTPWGREERTG